MGSQYSDQVGHSPVDLLVDDDMITERSQLFDFSDASSHAPRHRRLVVTTATETLALHLDARRHQHHHHGVGHELLDLPGPLHVDLDQDVAARGGIGHWRAVAVTQEFGVLQEAP